MEKIYKVGSSLPLTHFVYASNGDEALKISNKNHPDFRLFQRVYEKNETDGLIFIIG